jgi:hypothetical protein
MDERYMGERDGGTSPLGDRMVVIIGTGANLSLYPSY